MSIIEPLIRPSNTGTAYNILKLSDGRYWVAISANNSTSGTFIKNRDGSDSPFLLPVANTLLIIVEYNQDGFATKWTQSRCNRMSEAPDGSIYVMITESTSSYNIFNFTTTSTLPSATFTLSTSALGVILIKYTREGIAESWTKIDRSDNDFANGLFIDTNGDLYVSTRFQSTANSSNAGYSIFGFTTTNTLPTATFTIPNTPVATHSTFYTRYAIIAFNPDGTPKWWSAPNVNSNHIMADLLMDDTYLYASGSSGGSYAGSTARDNIAIPTRNFSITNTLGTAPFSIPAPSNRTGANIVKWNKTTGVAHSWVRIPSIGNDISSSVFMTLDNQGNLYVCGTYNTTTAVDVKNFHTENNDTHPVIFSLPATTGNAIFIVKWDSLGNAVGWNVIDGTGSDTVGRIAFDPVYKLVYFVGNYISTNPLQIRNFTETNTLGDTVITLPVSSVSKAFLVAWNTSGIVKKYKIIDSVSASTSGFLRIQENTIMYVGNYNSNTPVGISNISNTEYDGSEKYLLQSGTVTLPFFNTYDLDGNVFLTKPNKVLNTLEFNTLEFNNYSITSIDSLVSLGNLLLSGTNIELNNLNTSQGIVLSGTTTMTGNFNLSGQGSYEVNNFNDWVTQSITPDISWQELTWSPELSLIVAVSTDTVMTSPDGINWTTQITPTGSWRTVTWSPDLYLFAALGFGIIMTSPDGINWTTRTSPVSNQWRGVVWSKELQIFVAVSSTGTGNRAITSPDGINWTTQTTPEGSNWWGLTWSPELGIFVATGATTGTNNRVMTSSNGINWTTRTTPADNDWFEVVWSKELGLFTSVSTGGSNNNIMTSSDGINWTTRTTNNNNWRSITWAPEISLFVAVSSSGLGDRVMTSPDGINWTTRNSPIDNNWIGVIWIPELYRFVSLGNTGTNNRVMTWDPKRGSKFIINSTVKVGMGTEYPVEQLHIVGNTVLEQGEMDILSNETTSLANENYEWFTQTTNDNDWLRLAWSPELSLFVATSTSGGNTSGVMTSPDGITWTTRTTNTNQWRAVVWAKELNLFVAVAQTGTGNRVMTSPDGITWTTRTSAADNDWRYVIWAKELNLLVAVSSNGSGNHVMTSPDGITWTTRTSAADNDWQSIVWSKELNLLVAVSRTGTLNRVMTSPDGINWTTRTTNNNGWRSITWSSELSLFVAVALSGTNDRVMTSPDGINWTTRTSAADNQWSSVIWAKEIGLLVAVSDTGTNNRVMTSSDGINWITRTTLVNNQWFGLVWSPELSRFVAVANTGTNNRVMTWSIPRARNTVRIRNTKIGINTTSQLGLDVNGTIRSNNYVGTSDIRVKKDINLFLPNELKLPNIYEYTLLTTGQKELGFIAQEVEEMYPEAVSTISDFIPDINKVVNVNGNIIHLDNHNVKQGEIIRVNEKETKVINTTENTITVDYIFKDTNVYVYGRKVNDFKIINEEYLYLMNFAITKELMKIDEEIRKR